MAGRNPNEAVANFLEPLADAIGCFAKGRLSANVRTPYSEGVCHFNRANDVSLRGTTGIVVSFSMRYQVVEDTDPVRGPWKVTTTGWMYTLRNEGGELYEYHWHPISSSHVLTPHVHVGGQDRHIPTGRVMVEDVLELAREMGAECSDRWASLVTGNREKFMRGACWVSC